MNWTNTTPWNRTWIALILVALPSTTLLSTQAMSQDKPAPGKDEKADKEAGPKLQGIPWAKSYKEAIEESKKRELPIMVDFGAEWCGWCKKLDRDTFGNVKVIEAVRANFVSVKVDTDKEPAISKKYGVQGLPTILFLAPGGGEELHRLSGYRQPDVFLKDIAKPASSSKTLKDLKATLEKNPGDLATIRAYARAVFALGNTKDAATTLEKALELHSDDAGILLDLADVQQGAGQLKKARDLYERILKLPAEKAGAEQKLVHLPYGKLLISMRDHKSAVGALGKFLDSNPPSTAEKADNSVIWEAHFWRGYAFAVLKDAKNALSDLRAVQEKDQGGWGLRANYIIDIVESAE